MTGTISQVEQYALAIGRFFMVEYSYLAKCEGAYQK